MNISSSLAAKPKHCRDLIITVLSSKWPLSVKEIYALVARQHSSTLTYQAIHKGIIELLNEKIIAKNEGKYQLAKEWIVKNKLQFLNLENKYSNLNDYTSNTLVFANAMEMGRWLINFVLEQLGSKEPAIWRWWQPWPIFGFSDQELPILEQYFSKRPFHIFYKETSPLDKFNLTAINKMCSKITRLSDCPKDPDILIVDDYLIEFYFLKLKTDWRKMALKINGIPHFSYPQAVKLISTKEYPVHVIINKNKAVTDDLRKQYLKLVKK